MLFRSDAQARTAAEVRLDTWLLALPDAHPHLRPELANLLAAAPRALARGDVDAAARLALRVVRASERPGPLMPAAELCVVVADAWPDPTAPLYGALRLAAGTCMSRAADWKRANVQFARIEHDPVVGREARALLAHGARNLSRRDEAEIGRAHV